MRTFETVLADSRASVKGYLSAGRVFPANKLIQKHISQIENLVSIITQLQLDHPISLLSNGTLDLNLLLELEQSKCISERFIIKLDQLSKQSRCSGFKLKAFDFK